MKSIWRGNPYGSRYWPSEKARDAEKALGITRIYYPTHMFDPAADAFVPNTLQMTSQYCTDISTRFEFGIYEHTDGWGLPATATAIVSRMDYYFKKCGNVKGVMFNIELHNINQLIIDLITLWREKHSTGPIAWAMEGFQGGWMNKVMISKVNDDPNMVVVPENFDGNMNPLAPRNGVTPKQELINLGFASNRVVEFYDGAKPLPANWNGCILSEERLPSYNS
jgi:hypothetical protein